MKQIIIVFLLCAASISSTADSDTRGFVAFFAFVPESDHDYVEVIGDFDFHYKNMVPWLGAHGYKHSYHLSAPIEIEALGQTYSHEHLKVTLGTLLVRRDGSYKVVNGVATDIDLILEITAFFETEV